MFLTGNLLNLSNLEKVKPELDFLGRIDRRNFDSFWDSLRLRVCVSFDWQCVDDGSLNFKFALVGESKSGREYGVSVQ